MKLRRFIIVWGSLSFFITILIISRANFSGFVDLSAQDSFQLIDSITQDTEPPNLSIVAPENLSIITGWFFISVTATDNVSIDTIVYRNIYSETDFTPMDQNETDSTKFRVLVDSRKFQNGVNFFEIIGNDTSNNINRLLLMIGVQNLEAEADIHVYNVTGLTGECPCLDDDNTSIFWSNIESHPIPEFGGYLKFSHNFTHFFGLLVYDSSLDWISIQFDNDGDGICMENGEDIWWFSEGQESSDFTSIDFRTPQLDVEQDVLFEAGSQLGNDTNFKFFELIRPFVTSEPEDVVFSFGTPIGMIFASNALHQGGVRANFTLALKARPPDEFNGTDSLNNTLPPTGNSRIDLIYFGGIGLLLNITIITGIVIYDRRKRI